MTLKITRFLTDAMNKQAKIAHFPTKINVGAPKNIQLKFKEKISEQFGELFLNDANYIVMTKVDSSISDFDKFTKKFADLVAQVLDTEVAKTEVKTLQLSDTATDGEPDDVEDYDDDTEEKPEEQAAAATGGKVILLIKITTK